MKKLFAIVLLAGGSLFGQISLGIRIGPPPRPRIERVRPRSPGPGYVWVDGYWYPDGGHYRWHQGYYSRPPYEGAVWIAPRHDGQQFYNGYWEGPGHERVEHDHHSDRDRNRDWHDDRH
ncbi:MAG TPA: YXWGXW repeat-containing protein [Bryobacteraceae bacterium]|jgi:hypothetical protein|nr:YXWGXW repeat-containing protein [Bryobacteraceae bacterium]